jgi:putative ABC transport system permease protein
VSALWFDLRYTLRLLARSPGFALLCTTVIALALALSLTIYVLVRNQGLEALPLPDGDRYVALQLVQHPSGLELRGDAFPMHLLLALKQRTTAFEFFGGARLHGSTTINDGEITEAPWGTEVDPELLLRTGVEPVRGRLLDAADAEMGAVPVAMIGYDLWQNYFSAREDVIGLRVRMAGEPTTIVGVMPEGFRFPTDHHIWRPLKLDNNSLPGAFLTGAYTPVGILREGISGSQATAELITIMRELAATYPDEYGDRSAQVIPYIYSASATDFTSMNMVMLAAAVSILLLASLNVGNLLLVRANERSQELVIRSALGGTRQRIIRQVLLESLLIAVAGGMVGLWLGSFGAKFIRQQVEVVVGSNYLPFWMHFDVGSDIYILAATATLFIWLSAGGVPAWRASKLNIISAIAGSGKGISSRAGTRTIRTLVAAEIVFSFFLLILSGAFVSAVNITGDIDYGVATENTVSGLVRFDMQRYKDKADRAQYLEALQLELQARPDIDWVTFTTALPGMGLWHTGFGLEERDLREDGHWPRTQVIPVAPDYFTRLGTPLIQGRHFSVRDGADDLEVAIISEQIAQRFWPEESPLGKRLQLNPGEEESWAEPQWVTIVGVVAHIDQGQQLGRSKGLYSLYRPLRQFTPGFAYLLTRFKEDTPHYERIIKQASSQVNRDMAVIMLRPLAESMSISIRTLQTLSEFFVIVALVALVLAATGIYGVVSRAVMMRTREMGIRRALGQTDKETLQIFLRQGAFYLILGGVLGISGAVTATWLLTSEYPGLLNSIASIVIIVSTLMTALVLGASYLPARKIIALEPAEALHYE